MIRILTRCPVCDGRLKAIKLRCDTCSTVIENSFDFPGLLQLTKEQLDFVEVFVMCRGNIKDVEKELSISYPTVRAKLDGVVEVLQSGKKSGRVTHEGSVERSKITAIIKQLEDGELTPDEAIAEMNKS